MTSKELLDAAKSGRNDVVKALLEKKVDIESKDGDGWTPLHFAACQGHDDVVQTLLENQADVNAKADYGSTPLYFAAQNGHTPVVKTKDAAQEQCECR
mgnify:CR=1 FL=1